MDIVYVICAQRVHSSGVFEFGVRDVLARRSRPEAPIGHNRDFLEILRDVFRCAISQRFPMIS